MSAQELDTPWYARREEAVLGLRLALTVAVPLAVFYALGLETVGFWAAIGALNVGLTNFGGPRRMVVLGTSLETLAMAVAALVGPLIAHSPTAVVASSLAVALLAGYVGVLGDYWRVGAPLVLIVFVLAVGGAAPLGEALEGAAGVLIGGCCALAGFLIAPSPVGARRREPLSRAFTSVGRWLHRLGEAQPVPADLEATVAELNEVRDRLGTRPWSLGGHTVEEQQMIVLLHDAERLASDAARLTLSLQRRDADDLGQTDREQLASAGEALDGLAAAIRADRYPTARSITPGSPGQPVVREPVRAILDDLERAVANTIALANRALPSEPLEAGLTPLPPPPPGRARSYAATLRRNLTMRSPYVLHALKLAIGVTVATTVYLALGLQDQHGLWMPLTVIVVAQLTLAATFRKAMERLAGTVLGVLIGVALLFVIGSEPTATLALLPFLLFAIVYVEPAGYGPAVVFISISVVLLIGLFDPSGDAAAIDRLFSTLVGVAIGLAVSVAFWPRALHATVVRAGADLIAAVGQCLTSRPGEPACPAALEALRLYSANVRLYASQPATLRFASGDLYSLGRACTRLVETSLAARGGPEPLDAPALESVGDRLATISAALRAEQPAPPVAPIELPELPDTHARYLVETAAAEADRLALVERRLISRARS